MAPRKRSAGSSKAEVDKINRSKPSVRHVQRVGPTHAQGLQDLVGLYANVRQGEPCDGMRLDCEITCGQAPIRAGGQDLSLSLRTCFVSLVRANCEIRVGSLYEYWLDAGAYTSKATERDTKENQSQAGASASVDLAADTGLSWTAKLAAGLSFGRKSRRNRSTEITNQQKARIPSLSISVEE